MDESCASGAAPTQLLEVKTLTTFDRLVASSVLGAFSGSLEFAAGHPFDRVKTQLQLQASTGAGGTGRSVAAWVCSMSGLRGFYAGGSANFARLTGKAVYRHPTRGLIKKTIGQLLPPPLRHPATWWSADRRRDALNALTGLTMAATDAVVLTPMERLKVLRMTQPAASCHSGLGSQLGLWREEGRLLRELFRGVAPSLLRGCVSWCSYLVLEEAVADGLTGRYPAARPAGGVVAGTIGGLVNTALTLPLDNAKTQFQKHREGRAGGGGGVPCPGSVRQALSDVARVSGIRGLYAGWAVRLPHYVLVGTIQAQIVPRVDAVWGLQRRSSQL
jgi:hypothetical protein